MLYLAELGFRCVAVDRRGHPHVRLESGAPAGLRLCESGRASCIRMNGGTRFVHVTRGDMT